mgnify:FL=1
MEARVDKYEPYSVNEVGGGYFSFHLFANPQPVEVEREGEKIIEHKVDLFRTSMFRLENHEEAVLFVEKNWQLLVDECREQEKQTLAAEVRAERNRLLDKADIAVNIAVDNGDSEAESRARTWRQALRDIPEQSGFPYDVVWPKL